MRFIIEKQNSFLKNKKALDNIRNSQAGHILIDYRICCAMSNFCMKPCNPDGDDAIEIAKSIRKRSKKTQNKLVSLLKLRFSTALNTENIQDINDFPTLTLHQLKKKITFSSFKIRQCQSYLSQLLEHGKIFRLDTDVIEKYISNVEMLKELSSSKIIAVQIASRHKRGKKKLLSSNSDPNSFSTSYKVFIQYVPKGLTLNDKETARKKLKSHRLIKSI